MITFLFIIVIIIFIVSYNKKDKRIENADEKIQELPPIHFFSRQQNTGARFWSGELFESNGNVLREFNYNHGFLTLSMKNGKRVSDLLSAMTVRFEKLQGVTYITVKSKGSKVRIIMLGNFSDSQWETMIEVLMLAGTTYGASIFGSAYKNINRATLAIKIISKLS